MQSMRELSPLSILFLLLVFSCTKPENDSARTFFDFVCRDCNYLQVTEYHYTRDLGRKEPVLHQGYSGAFIDGCFFLIETVPWNPDTSPDPTEKYFGLWRSDRNLHIEESILQFYRKEPVRAFEHLEYRKDWLDHFEILSTDKVVAYSDQIMQEYQPGENLNELFDVIRTYIEGEQGYDDLIICSGGDVILRIPDRIPLKEYLQNDKMLVFSDICLFLKVKIDYARNFLFRVTLENGKVLERSWDVYL
ncbi:MAG: hypothetical protein IJ578_04145 [Bacteroidales bacterium]|nr:hypothetical protein [Bacteroidales bacterium]